MLTEKFPEVDAVPPDAVRLKGRSITIQLFDPRFLTYNSSFKPINPLLVSVTPPAAANVTSPEPVLAIYTTDPTEKATDASVGTVIVIAEVLVQTTTLS